MSDNHFTSFIQHSRSKHSNIASETKIGNNYHSAIWMYLRELDMPSTVWMRDNDIEYEYLNHAVVILGWGYDEEHQTKYWICSNSWGKNWGENGFFKVRRGTDEFSIESTAESFVPKITFS